MITREIEQWLRLYRSENSTPLGVVLHTSCLNYEPDQLLRLRRSGCRLVLPDNVYWEIKLLTESKTIYGTKAKSLLGMGDDVSPVPWDLEQLYLPDLGGMRREELYEGPMLFLFGDLNKQDEFLQNVCPLEDCHILIHTDWEMRGWPAICTLNTVRGCSYRKAVPLSLHQSVPELSSFSELRCISISHSSTVSGSEFVKTSMNGSYSQIYTHNSYPGRYFKVYRKKAYTGSSAGKLRALLQYGHKRPMTFAAFPESLLTTGDGLVLGYGMTGHQGRPLQEYCDSGWLGKKPTQVGTIIQKLLVLLLEMHLQGILINDLTYNNIMVSRNDAVCFVDCDSMQFREYPGGMLTDIYRHPEISCGSERVELRQPRHEYFALAVLLFQCYLYDDPLYGDGINWREAQFSLSEDLSADADVNTDLWENWKDLPPVLRRMFSDVFLLRRDHSIGAWYRALSEE